MEEKIATTVIENNAFGTLLLDVGISLLQAGANSERIRTAMSELAAVYQYVPLVTIGTSSVSLVLNDKNGNALFNDVRRTAVHGINFAVISGMSRLSWLAAEKGWSVQELKNEIKKCQAPGHYPRLVLLCFVSLAGAAFCYTFGGGYVEMAITFSATFCGLFVKQQLTRANFNPYIITYIAATAASFFTGLFHITGLIDSPVNAFSTCVLFLIPGVLLINSFTDLIEGSTVNGIAKGVNALSHIMAIALGLLTTIAILNLKE
ncbi:MULTISPECIES: threonine/serine exporter family protein [Niastella]|uniref:Threonine/serine exporter family protein n=1 Tax=Niastella soli TaxID=2821487 RepID=A0ABS3Z2N2_9BACT|nr:threonine/serine exporter family protein [Niastella soli]MBO9204283.1 threonine/serine exporter family protein [Niastella soli]